MKKNTFRFGGAERRGATLFPHPGEYATKGERMARNDSNSKLLHKKRNSRKPKSIESLA